MRTVGLLLCIALAGYGCKTKGEAQASADPAAVKAQQDLLARRNALLADREKLKTEATQVAEEIVKVSAAGGDTTELTKKKADIETKLNAQETSLTDASSQIEQLSSKIDAAGGVAGREAALARREAALAERERGLVAQATKLAELERTSADRWKESCTTGGGQTIIQQIAPPKSGNYSRKEVDSLVSRAKAGMTKKGLIASDLGAQASLESEILKAVSEQDWARGYVLADQLAKTVDAIVVNRPFVKAKFERLQNRVKAAKVDADTSTQLTAGLSEISKTYGDGDFAAANRRLNQLAALMR